MGPFKASGLTKECEKAAQILRSFVQKGKIPAEILSKAKGIAIFSGFRAGMYLAGTGGSGVVVARLADGTWSPPSAFSVRSGSFGLVYGVDVYDCVCVLNTPAAVEAYTKSEVNLGGAVALAAGPMTFDSKMAAEKPVWVYTKSRGLYGGLTVDGTVIKEKSDMNADFYGGKVSGEQILRGEVSQQAGDSKWPAGASKLTEVLKLAEGKTADKTVLQDISNEPTPGDLTQ